MAQRERNSQPQQQGSRRQPPARRDVIRCENCGEDYSVTYRRCPFCDERPGKSAIGGGRRVSGKNRVHPVQMITLVVSMVLIIAALFIVFKHVGPLLFGDGSTSGSGSSVSSSQGSASGSQGDVSQPDVSGEGSGSGSQDEPVVVVKATSITLNREEFTLQPGEPFQVTATVLPADTTETVVWTIADTTLATVDEYGTVTNINAGTQLGKTVLTATCGDVKAECVVFCRPSGEGGGESQPDPQPPVVTPSTEKVKPGTFGTIVNAGSGLSIRSGPGREYERVASASNGARIQIKEDTGTGWYKIDYSNGKTGYVASDYVKLEK